ncbi:MAG: cob(I)yrinic acid a,c-diamide adenosyltransferase [Paludibacteraceae bacterium]|nr:cob(I)yrinic acid a,c-diamide adenosyltransferase [Paludibacteraceae bacterium]
MKIYTKTGDTGTTSLIGGKRVSKCDGHLEVYGTLDELSSFIGLLKNEPKICECSYELNKIQQILTKINICFACPDSESEKKYEFEQSDTEWIEKKIDEISANLPPIDKFLIPGTNSANALANICRTICRRAERNAYKIQMSENQQKATVFLNRLSDYFFVLGRKIE